MFWVKEHIKRYEFISKYCYGKVLDCKFNNFSSFHSAQILLKNDCREVSTYYKKTNEVVKRVRRENNIGFENKNTIIYRLGSLVVEDVEKCIGDITFAGTSSPSIPSIIFGFIIFHNI